MNYISRALICACALVANTSEALTTFTLQNNNGTLNAQVTITYTKKDAACDVTPAKGILVTAYIPPQKKQEFPRVFEGSCPASISTVEIKYVNIDGKNFDISKTFAGTEINQSTKVINCNKDSKTIILSTP